MKIAVVDKVKGPDRYKEFLKFDYDLFHLTSKNVTKMLKKDITLQEDFSEYDYVVLIGREPAKFIGKISNVTKYSGHLMQDKYIPIINPIAAKFNPGLKGSIDAGLIKLHSHITGNYEETVGTYEGITSAQRAKEWLTKLLRKTKVEYVVTDIETSSLYPREGYILGIAMSYEIGTGVYIESDCIDEEIEDLLQQVFNKFMIVFHNAKFDIKWLEFHFNFVFPHYHDSMLQHYLLNENEPHDLKYLAIKYTKMGDYDRELEEFKNNYCKAHGILKRDFSYEYIPFDVMFEYAGGDADATLRLIKKFNPIIEGHFKKLYNDIMIRGTNFLIDIEENGVPFSKAALEKANVEFTQQIFDATESLYEFEEVKDLEKEMGKKFNPGSPVQLRELFFNKLGLTPSKKTPKGEWSTDKDVLADLADQHPIANIISKIRGLSKLRSTYIIKVLKEMDIDGRLRTSFNLHIATSGRLSSSGKLNMQQLPRDDKTVKSCIVPDIKDYVIFSQDLSTAEMYYAAALSGDKNLAQVFIDGGDFHSSIAKLTFNLTCPVEKVAELYPHLRQASKAISFGILYGAGAAKVASSAGISFGEAKEIIKQYFDKFNKLKDWIESTKATIANNGYVYSAFGRKRRVPDVFSVDDYAQGHAIRSAMNFTVQSVASDINLISAMDVNDVIKSNGLRAEIFGLVHDSILGQCHKDDVVMIENLLKKHTQKDRGVSIVGCPIGVDFGYGESYAKAA